MAKWNIKDFFLNVVSPLYCSNKGTHDQFLSDSYLDYFGGLFFEDFEGEEVFEEFPINIKHANDFVVILLTLVLSSKKNVVRGILQIHNITTLISTTVDFVDQYWRMQAHFYNRIPNVKVLLSDVEVNSLPKLLADNVYQDNFMLFVIKNVTATPEKIRIIEDFCVKGDINYIILRQV